jgi:hypothetical protein
VVQFIQQFFLNPILIFFILIVAFVVVSVWSIRQRQEYIGYGLGWLIGLFGMVIYGALVGDNEAVAQADPITETAMNVLQVTIPSIIGIGLGAWTMSLVVQSRKTGMLRSIIVAFLTALSLWLVFSLLVSAPYPTTQRMLGLFTWAFGIGALTMIAIARQGSARIPSIMNPQANPSADPAGRNVTPTRQVPSAKIDDPNTRPSFRDRVDRR